MTAPTATADTTTVTARTFYDPVVAFPTVDRGWESEAIVAELAMSADTGEETGDWSVKFYDFALPGHMHEPPYLRIEAFGDGLAALHATGLIQLLVERGITQINQADFVALLTEHGWTDTTLAAAVRS